MLELFHDDGTYDPAKAHEYYLRTRELKGRRPGQQQDPSGIGRSSAPVHSSQQSAAQQRAAAAARLKRQADARVFELKVKLRKLEAILKKLHEQAKRQGIEASKGKNANGADATQGGGGDAKKDPSKMTAEEKQKAQERQKKYYERHKQAILKKQREQRADLQIKDLTEKIQKVQDRIEAERVKLAAGV